MQVLIQILQVYSKLQVGEDRLDTWSIRSLNRSDKLEISIREAQLVLEMEDLIGYRRLNIRHMKEVLIG